MIQQSLKLGNFVYVVLHVRYYDVDYVNDDEYVMVEFSEVVGAASLIWKV